MHEPTDAFPPSEDPGFLSIDPQAGRPGVSSDARCGGPSTAQRLAELQEERQQLSRVLQQMPDAIPSGEELARRLFLDLWCERVLEIETEMDRLRAAIQSEASVSPLELRLIRWVFTARWRYDRARRRGLARLRPRCRAVVRRHSGGGNPSHGRFIRT